jgi:hypothetical protein
VASEAPDMASFYSNICSSRCSSAHPVDNSSHPSQPQYRQDAIGLLLVAGHARPARDDLRPGLRPPRSLELLGLHTVPMPAHLDPHPIRVSRDVVVPAGVVRCTAEGRDHQPRTLTVGLVARPRAPVVHQARGVYIRLLMDTLGAHLADAALDEVATSMRKLHEALRDRQGEAASTPRTAEPRFGEQIRRGADEAAGP